MDKKNKLFSIKKEHESASKHVSGKAKYIDDIPEPKNLLHTAIGYSQIAKGKIKSIYFDTLNYNYFTDSEEGQTPRKKIRLRSYNKDKTYSLEFKFSNAYHRKKIVINNNLVSKDAISFDPTSADVMGYEGGDATFTLVLVLDWNNPLAVYSAGSG